MTKQNENRVIDIYNAVSVRSEADSNRCTRFCRPLPSHSAIRPYAYSDRSPHPVRNAGIRTFGRANIRTFPNSAKLLRNFALFPRKYLPLPHAKPLSRAIMTIEDIALQMTPGIGVKGAAHLLDRFGDARRIFGTPADELVDRAGLRPDLAQHLVRRKGFPAAEREMDYCRRNGITIVASTDAEYPRLLREIPDYPHVLYIRGNVEALSARCLSVVGTRRATPYGQSMCDRLVGGLAERIPGLCIVSGLAFGIDAAAHRAALAAGVPTVAVLANALPDIMPTQHTALARDLLDRGGALVSELHSQTRQNGTFYLARNRLIAGLSAGCLVVESPDTGGSLVTAHYADGYERTVMAVPGRATDSASAGTNHLIRNRKAQLVLSADDIVRELMWDFGTDPAAFREKPAAQPLTREEKALLDAFGSDDPVAADTLAERSGLDPGSLAALLIGLELAGAVRQLPGNRYLKLR